MLFMSTSAKTGENVEEAFTTLARGILEETGQGRQSLGAAGASATKAHRLTPVSDGMSYRGDNFPSLLDPLI